jgi:hypothetical protein
MSKSSKCKFSKFSKDVGEYSKSNFENICITLNFEQFSKHAEILANLCKARKKLYCYF